METVRQVAAANVPVPTASPFRFELTAEAAAHNTGILESFDYDLASAIDAFPGTTISPGSELRPPEQLQPLLRHHPTWMSSTTTCCTGSSTPSWRRSTSELGRPS